MLVKLAFGAPTLLPFTKTLCVERVSTRLRASALIQLLQTDRTIVAVVYIRRLNDQSLPRSLLVGGELLVGILLRTALRSR